MGFSPELGIPGNFTKVQVLSVVLVVTVLSGGAFYTLSGSSEDTESPGKPKVALIVLDGMDWTPVRQLEERERIPNMEEMMDEGVYTELVTPRAFSPITWTKISSGQSTRDVNVDGWNVQENGRTRMVQSKDVENRRIWDYLNDANISTGVTGWMLTWPVERIKGFMIAGPLATSDTRLVHPRYKFQDKEVIKTGNEWEIAHMVLNRTKNDYPFLALGFKNLDTYQHQLWKFVEPEKFDLELEKEDRKYREVVYTEYENLDEVVGRFDDEWNVFVMGDSGFNAEMEEYGYAAPTYENDLTPLLVELGYTNISKKLVKGTEITRVQDGSKLKRCPVLYPGNDVINHRNYYVRMCILDDSMDVNETIDHLENVTYRDGEEFFYDLHYVPDLDSIKGKIKIRQSGVVEEKMKLALAPQPHVSGESYYVDKAIGLELPDGESFNLWIGPEKSGDHPPGTDSVFMAKGPAIADKGNLSRVEVSASDITPTLLYLYGLPIPEGMDGEPVEEIFTREFNDRNEPSYINVSTEKSGSDKPYFQERDEANAEVLKDRLKNLGYTVQ